MRAQAEHPLKTVYLGMNGFTINPDLWLSDAFGFRRAGPLPDAYRDARALAVALVIVKVQQLLQAALPLTNHPRCPLWATAHDHCEYLVRIVGRTEQTPAV